MMGRFHLGKIMITIEEAKDVLIGELQEEVTKLKKLNELWEARFNNMEIRFKNARGDYENE